MNHLSDNISPSFRHGIITRTDTYDALHPEREITLHAGHNMPGPPEQAGLNWEMVEDETFGMIPRWFHEMLERSRRAGWGPS